MAHILLVMKKSQHASLRYVYKFGDGVFLSLRGLCDTEVEIRKIAALSHDMVYNYRQTVL